MANNDQTRRGENDLALEHKFTVDDEGGIVKSTSSACTPYSVNDNAAIVEDELGTVSALPDTPTLDITQRSMAIASVAITDSENVHLGNKTYFNGPVTIKQYYEEKSGIENVTYVTTETKHVVERASQTSLKAIIQKNIKKWPKVVLSVFVITILTFICVMISTIYAKSLNEHGPLQVSSGLHPKSKDMETLSVEGCYYIHWIVLVTCGVLLLSNLKLLLTNTGVEHVSKNGHLETPPNYKGAIPIVAPDDVLRMVSRSDWLAQPEEGPLDPIQHPIPWVIISHTATENCNIQSECVLRVRLIQSFHIESRSWYDIGYNFLVGGDGSVYIGRGWDYVGAHTKGYNTRSIGIAFIGTFNNEAPPRQQIEACLKLISLGVKLGKLSEDYKVLAHRQLISSLSPGEVLFKLLHEWPHFVKNFTAISELY